MLEACLLEAEVLQQLAGALPVESVDRVPRYVVHGVTNAAASMTPLVKPPGAVASPVSAECKSHVLLAMSKLEGQPLDRWLYGVDEHRLKTLPVATLLDGPLPGGRLASSDHSEASVSAAALLLQMAPVFGALSEIAYHRDVSAHNFLVRAAEGPEPMQFAILDFGLAVRARVWRQEWQTRNIAGDPRYFPPAAWMLLTYGHKYLEAHPDQGLRRQYRCRIDHYALGVLSLEVFFALWQGPGCPEGAESEDGAATAARAEDPEVAALLKVRTAWREYWTHVMGFFQTFHAQGARKMRESLARSQALSQLVEKLRALCLALKSAAAQAPQSPAAPVLQAAAGLLDWHSALSWQELPELLALEGRRLPVETAPAALGASIDGAGSGSGRGSSQPSEAPPLSPRPRTFSFSHRRVHTEMERESKAAPAQATGAAVATAAAAPAAASTAAVTVAEEASSGARHGERRDEEGHSDGRPSARETTEAPRSPIAAKPVRKMFSHRRVWTVDEAVSLGRGVPQVGMGHGGSQPS